jgi:type II secretory pathway predicted ATPase ExeA
MYETFYGLRTNPFSLVPDPGFLYLGKQHKLALSLLEYGLLNRAVFTVITGEPGTGKTTLLNAILDQSQHQVTVGVLSNTHAGLGSLMPWVLMAFNINGKGMDSVELYRTFAAFIAREYGQRRRVVLVVDEAQNLGSAMLEELRLLSNLNDGRRQSLHIILSGQPGLRTLLQRSDLIQFAQRVSVDYHLEPLDEEETPMYIRHRLAVAGMSAPVMTELACRVVHRLAGGNARLINQVCDVSLAYGFAEQVRLVTARLVMKAAADRAASGILPVAQFPVTDLCTSEMKQKEDDEVRSASSANRADPARVEKPEAREHGMRTSYERGLAYKEAGQYRQAIACFDQVREDPAMTVKADIQTALCYRAVDRLDDAATVLRVLLKDKKGTDGERRQIRYILARIYERLGRTEQALTHYRILQQDDPAYRDTAARLGQLSSSRGWSSVLARPFTSSWFRSMTKSWVHLLRISM